MAHKLSTISEVVTIIVLKNGQDEGSPRSSARLLTTIVAGSVLADELFISICIDQNEMKDYHHLLHLFYLKIMKLLPDMYTRSWHLDCQNLVTACFDVINHLGPVAPHTSPLGFSRLAFHTATEAGQPTAQQQHGSSNSPPTRGTYSPLVYLFITLPSPSGILNEMAKEGFSAEVAIIPKFDMPHNRSIMSPKDVKLLARKYNIPLDLHPDALSEGWTMDKLPEEAIGLYEQFFDFSGLRVPFSILLLGIIKHFRGGKECRGRAIPDAMAWRHHDSDVNDTLSDGDFSILDVRGLSERVIDLRPIHPGLLFAAGLATTWDFPGCYPTFKVVTMSEYLRFPFHSGASIENRAVIPANHQLGQNTTPSLLVDQPIPDKTDHQLEVEVKDPKVIDTKEKKKAQAVKAATKKRKNLKRTNDEGGSSKSKHKKRRTLAKKESDGRNEETQNASEDEHYVSLHSPRESADESVHNFINIDDDKRKDSPLHLEPFVNLSEKPITANKEQLILLSLYLHVLSWSAVIYVPDWGIPHRCRVVTPVWCRELMVHLAPPTVQEESNALTNEVTLQRACLADAHAECSDTVWKLVTSCQDLEHNARLYTDAINCYKDLKEEHAGCGQKVKVLEDERNNLSTANKDQSLRIQELEAEIAQKDSALAAAERMLVKGDKERQKLVAQLSQTEVEKFDCVRKLLPTVVG
ncbi:hypothetical protein Tco_1243098 [Tanacetum coccineum]